MAGITREEFKKIYDEKFVPILEPLESERVELLKKTKKWNLIVGVPLFITLLVIFFLLFLKSDDVWVDSLAAYIGVFFNASLFSLFLTFNCLFVINLVINSKNLKIKIKNELMPKILSVYGNLHFSQNKGVITLKEIKSFGLFPNATQEHIDDVIIGIDKGRNFIIVDADFRHTEIKHGKSRDVFDFNGIIVKSQLNKNFTGQTVVGETGNISKKKGFENVVLESIDFMQARKVYSTDQIEARYILTTDFIERLESLAIAFKQEYQLTMAKTQENFSKNVTIYNGIVSAIFTEGFVYLFIPTNVNFFEIDIETLLNSEQYYKIYYELEAILSVFDYLNLDSKTGL